MSFKMDNLYLKTIREGSLEKLICVLGDITTKNVTERGRNKWTEIQGYVLVSWEKTVIVQSQFASKIILEKERFYRDIPVTDK